MRHFLTQWILTSTMLCWITPANAQNQPQQGTERRFAIQRSGKHGYINERGNVVIPATFHAASEFSEGVAIVMPDLNSGAIVDLAGKKITGLPLYKNIQPFSESMAVVMEQNRCGFINTKGEPVIPPAFSAAAEFSEGFAAVADSSGKWGWIDKQGAFVIKPAFELAGEFKEGLARIQLGKKAGFIDRTGKVVVEPVYSVAQDYSEGLALVWLPDQSKRYLDKKGNVVISLSADALAQSFSEGLAAVKISGTAGFIDKTGKMVIRTSFDAVSSFSEGFAPVQTGGKWGCVDKSGKIIIPLKFSSRPVFRNGLAKIKTPEGIGYINRTGAWVWPPSR